jgi:hypothetical protein
MSEQFERWLTEISAEVPPPRWAADRRIAQEVFNSLTAGLQRDAQQQEIAALTDYAIAADKSMQRALARLRVVEDKLKALEEGQLRFAGTWRAGDYAKNTLTLRHGSLWLSQAATSDIPGNGQTSWQLVTKGR